MGTTLYLDYFGLTDSPFRITPNTDYWFEGGQRGDLLATLVYAITHGEGLIKVVGEVGSGKTMLCRMLQQQLPENIDTVYLGNPSLQPDEILVTILSDLGVTGSVAGSRQILLDQLNNALLSRHSSGRRVVAFVEEAQGMTLESLEFMRLLTNLETSSDKLLQIVLFGQPELNQILADRRIRQFKDRITLNLTLTPLTEIETGHYLRSRLQRAGYRGPDLFPTSVVKRIAKLSDGLSRRINILADKTMLAAFGNNTHNILPAHVNAAVRDAEMETLQPSLTKRFPWSWAMIGLIAGLSLLAFIALRDLDAMIAGGSEAQDLSVQTTQAQFAATPAPTFVAHISSADWASLPALEEPDRKWPSTAEIFTMQNQSAFGEGKANSFLRDMHMPPHPIQSFPSNLAKEPDWLTFPVEYPIHVSALNAPVQPTSEIRAKFAQEEPHE